MRLATRNSGPATMPPANRVPVLAPASVLVSALVLLPALVPVLVPVMQSSWAVDTRNGN